MKKKLTKRMLLGVLAAAMFGISANDAVAQTFTNGAAGVYNASCGAVIRLKAAGTDAAISGNNLGTAALPIPGVVEYTRASGTQEVKPYYYNQLILSGASTKTVPTGIFVMGTQCPSFLTGYGELANYPYLIASGSGTVTYSDGGTFNYAGTDVQNIFPDQYQTIAVTGAGNAVVPDGQTVEAENITSVTGAPILVDGTLTLTTGVSNIAGNLTVTNNGTLTTGAGNVTIDGDLASTGGTITTGGGIVNMAGDVALSGDGTFTTGAGAVTFTNAGTLDLAGTAAITVAGIGDVAMNGPVTTANGTSIVMTGTGDLNVGGDLTLAGLLDADNGAAGAIGDVNLDGTTTIAATGNVQLGSNTNMIISGAITNAGDGNNLAFNCGSNVTYDGAAGQLVLPTGLGKYGNLFLAGGNKVGGTAGATNADVNISLCGNFDLKDGNLSMIANSGSLIMTDATKAATYEDQFEVAGRMQRNWTSGTTNYTFNNAKTTVVLTGGTTSGATDYFAMDVRPGVSPRQYVAGSDVNRKIVMDYNFAGWSANVQVGYLAGEQPSFAAGTPGENLTLSDLKYFEADGSGIEKIGGTGYGTASTTDPMRHMSMAGILPGTGNVDNIIERNFTSGHDLVLRANNTMYNIADGRWTNPNTWDEGRVPTANDNVELRYSVYVGIDGGFIGTTGGADDTPTANTKSEYAHYGNTDAAAAKRIIIADKLDDTGGPTPNPALIIGNEDNPAGYIFKTASGGVINNNNATTATLTWPIDPGATSLNRKELITSGQIQGIWVTPFVTGSNIPGLGAAAITNAGTVNNQGIIEIGE